MKKEATFCDIFSCTSLSIGKCFVCDSDICSAHSINAFGYTICTACNQGVKPALDSKSKGKESLKQFVLSAVQTTKDIDLKISTEKSISKDTDLNI